MDLDETKRLAWLSRVGLIAGVVGVVVCAGFALQDAAWALEGCLYAFSTLWPISLACMGLLALGNLTGGGWASAMRPYYRAGAWTMPLVALLFLPIALGIDPLYPWAESGASADPHLEKKLAYLNKPFFLARSVGYLAAWLVIAMVVVGTSRYHRQPGETRLMRRLGAFSLLLIVATGTFAAFDWTMSLEPQWYSSIYGALILACGIVAAHARCIGLSTTLPDSCLLGEDSAAATNAKHAPDVRNDLASLLLAFVMVWAYFSFSQFLIIWSGNLPSEISWYLHRLDGGWQWLALAVVVLHLVIPFFSLLSRDVKRSPVGLCRVACLLLAMYAVHMYWVVQPAFSPDEFVLGVPHLAAMVGGGGIWLASFCWFARREIQRFCTESHPSD